MTSQEREPISEVARKLWGFCWGRTINLHTVRMPPYVTLDEAPDDTPALYHVQALLTSERRAALAEQVVIVKAMRHTLEHTLEMAQLVAAARPHDGSQLDADLEELLLLVKNTLALADALDKR